MMHVFYCAKCKRYHYTNKQNRALCCGHAMYHVEIEFTDFIAMSREEREDYLKSHALAE